MFKVAGYTLLNIRYASLILPTGIVAYLLQLYPLAIASGILLVAAYGAEVALSIANGVEMHQSVKLQHMMEKQEEEYFAAAIAKLENHANDWVGINNGSEGEASDEEGEGPDEGQGPVPSR